MNGNKVSGAAGKLKVILPVILRITFCLVMWTLGAMTMTIAEAQTEAHRVVPEIPVGSAHVLNPGVPQMPITIRITAFALKRLRATFWTEVCASDFHQKQSKNPSTDQPGGPDHAARCSLVQTTIQ